MNASFILLYSVSQLLQLIYASSWKKKKQKSNQNPKLIAINNHFMDYVLLNISSEEQLNNFRALIFYIEQLTYTSLNKIEPNRNKIFILKIIKKQS